MRVLLSSSLLKSKVWPKVLKTFYFCSNYVMGGQLFLLHNVFGTFSFLISFFLLNLPTHSKELLRGAREFVENHYNFRLPEFFF